MLRNSLCPYCGVLMVKGENLKHGRSVEHLIPNVVLRHKRSNGQGDFYACRRCNGDKSHMDYVLAVIAKSQAHDDHFAAQTLIDAVTEGDGRRASRFIDMIRDVEETPRGAEMTLPLSGNELLKYMEYLGKGQYFKRTGRVFQTSTHVMLFDYVNKEVMRFIEGNYGIEHGSNPFRDLEQNHYSEVLSDGDCIIYSKNLTFLFLFHDYTGIAICVKPRNRKNMERARLNRQQIITDFARTISTG